MLKGLSERHSRELALVSSGALLYITRGSTLFLMPLCGMILDGIIPANLALISFALGVGLLIHSLHLVLCFHQIAEKLPIILDFYQRSRFKVFIAPLYVLSSFKVEPLGRGIPLNFPAAVGFMVLSGVFPIVIYMGMEFSHLRASILTGYGLVTGVFALYMTLFVERKFAMRNIPQEEAILFGKSILYSKCIGMSCGAVFLILASFYLMAKSH